MLFLRRLGYNVPMPYLYAHYVTGKMAVQCMDAQAQRAVSAEPEAFFLGCQGADVFFYHHLLRRGFARKKDWLSFSPAADWPRFFRDAGARPGRRGMVFLLFRVPLPLCVGLRCPTPISTTAAVMRIIPGLRRTVIPVCSCRKGTSFARFRPGSYLSGQLPHPKTGWLLCPRSGARIREGYQGHFPLGLSQNETHPEDRL